MKKRILCSVVMTLFITFFVSSCKDDDDNNVAAVAVTGVSLNKTSLSLDLGGVEKLIATITPTGATNLAVVWTSSKPTVAEVASDGTVTAKAEGETIITVTTDDGGMKATCTVTVLGEELPQTTVVYSSNFANSLDGWLLRTESGEATINRVGDRLVVDVTTKAENTWNIQLYKPGISLKKGYQYDITYKVSFDSFSAYVERGFEPWGVYDGSWMEFSEREENKVITHSFVKTDDNDTDAKLDFNLGGAVAKFALISYKLEESLPE